MEFLGKVTTLLEGRLLEDLEDLEEDLEDLLCLCIPAAMEEALDLWKKLFLESREMTTLSLLKFLKLLSSVTDRFENV